MAFGAGAALAAGAGASLAGEACAGVDFLTLHNQKRGVLYSLSPLRIFTKTASPHLPETCPETNVLEPGKSGLASEKRPGPPTYASLKDTSLPPYSYPRSLTPTHPPTSG